MQSLSLYARLFARAISSTEAEHILFNGLLRLSSSLVHVIPPSNSLAITYPSTAIKHAVHLVTVSSGYSSHDNNEHEYMNKAKRRNSLIEQQSHSSNVYGDDAFFVTRHRFGDFLGMSHYIDKKFK